MKQQQERKEKRVPPVSVVCSSTIKHKPIFLNEGNEIGDNSFSSLIHFTHQQPPEAEKTSSLFTVAKTATNQKEKEEKKKPNDPVGIPVIDLAKA